jgi:hypothetical protein
LDEFRPDTAQANYCKAILPGGRARFNLRFWNLEEEELQRLIWCVVLQPELAHKLGRHRHLGFGSLRLHLSSESHLIDWPQRYAGSAQEWKRSIEVADWLDLRVVAHRRELQRALHAESL